MILRIAAAALAASGLALAADGAWMQAKAALAQLLLERAFSAAQLGEADPRPWPWADVRPVAHLEAPRLGVAAIVLQGASGEALAFGPGALDGAPQAGEEGTAIYAGHRDSHFAFVGELVPGDELRVVRRDGLRLRFRVTHSSVARWDASGLDSHALGHGLVLATCWPLDSHAAGPMRYLVHARLVGGEAASRL